jgi:hypothetical protein
MSRRTARFLVESEHTPLATTDFEQLSSKELSKFRDDQPRDELGRWVEISGSVATLKGPEYPGSRTVDAVAMALSGTPLAIVENAGMTSDERAQVQENLRHMVDVGTREVQYEVRAWAVAGGIDPRTWYDSDIATAMEVTQEHLPTLKDNPTKQALFAAVAGVLANGTKPAANWSAAAKAFQHYEDTGTIPGKNPYNDNKSWSMHGNVIEQQLDALNILVHAAGEQGAVEWLFGQHTEREIDQARQSLMHLRPSLVQRRANNMVPGYTAFGPKLGEFIGAMNGVETVVVDRWGARTIGRWSGRTTEQERQRDGTYRTIARTIPTEPERRAYSHAIRQIAQRTGLRDEQVQAVLWYHEQRLYSHMGARSKASAFSDGARTYAAWRTGNGKVRKFVPISFLAPVPPAPESWDGPGEGDMMLATIIRMRLGLEKPGQEPKPFNLFSKADLRTIVRKEWTASASPTSGITAYGNTPKKKKARRRPRPWKTKRL